MVRASTDMPGLHLNPSFPAFATAALVGRPVYALVFRPARSVLDPIDSIDTDPGTRSAPVCSPHIIARLSTPHFQSLAARARSDGRAESRSAAMAMQGRSYVAMCARPVLPYDTFNAGLSLQPAGSYGTLKHAGSKAVNGYKSGPGALGTLLQKTDREGSWGFGWRKWGG